MRLILAGLRNLFANANIDAYIIPSFDEFSGEYTADYAKRLEYITGFTGSYGVALISLDFAILFTDGRYITQARQEVKGELDVYNILDFAKVLSSLNLEKVRNLGYDPKLFNYNQLSSYLKFFNLTSLPNNLVDEVWQDKPKKPSSKIFLYPDLYAGLSYKDKIKILCSKIKNFAADFYFTYSGENICWLLNLRASDLEYTPIFHGYMLVSSEKVYIFTNIERVDESLKRNFSEVVFFPEDMLGNFIRDNLLNKVILTCKKSLSVHFANLFDSLNIKLQDEDPILLNKAIKNTSEIFHSKQVHIRDAVAICEAFSELDLLLKRSSEVSEYDFAAILTDKRSMQEGFISNSFHPICAYKENAAIIHYRPISQNAKNLNHDSGLFLVDSGGQYFGGTTDVTRTIAIGEIKDIYKIRYTQVLKGHIALMLIYFPLNTRGYQIDSLARQYLWREKLDYAHGTGHGVGSALSVHEGPQRIGAGGNQVLMEGMILSNEPGFYHDDFFGIRIENLVYIVKDGNWLRFENLTLVPYCDDLIVWDMLCADEINYLEKYKQRIMNEVYPHLSEQAKNWLVN